MAAADWETAVTRRALFFPSCGGQGFGHLNRCLLLAQALNRRGWDARLCVTPARAAALAGRGVDLICVPELDYSRPGSSAAPAYTCLSNGNLQALRDGFTSFPRVARSVYAAENAVRTFRPDTIVGDLSLLAWIVGQRLGIRVAQMVRSIIHPEAHQIFWWRPPPTADQPPDIRPVFNPLLRWWKLSRVNSVEDLMQGDLYLVPSIPSLDPLPHGLENTHYTGPLIDPAAAATLLPDDFPSRENGRVIYVTFGGGAGLEQARPLLDALQKAVSGSGWQMALSGGGRVDSRALADFGAFRIFDWLPGPSAIRASDCVVYHGGQNTTLELAAAGVPGLALPFQSEQESNGRRLEQQGAGRVISPLDGGEMRVIRSRRWYRPFQTCIVPEFAPDPAALRAALSTLLEQPEFRENAQRLRQEAGRYGGVELAADLLERNQG